MQPIIQILWNMTIKLCACFWIGTVDIACWNVLEKCFGCNMWSRQHSCLGSETTAWGQEIESPCTGASRDKLKRTTPQKSRFVLRAFKICWNCAQRVVWYMLWVQEVKKVNWHTHPSMLYREVQDSFCWCWSSIFNFFCYALLLLCEVVGVCVLSLSMVWFPCIFSRAVQCLLFKINMAVYICLPNQTCICNARRDALRAVRSALQLTLLKKVFVELMNGHPCL